MRIAFFDAHKFEKGIFEEELRRAQVTHEVTFFDARLSADTALLASGFDCVCSFVNDTLDQKTIEALKNLGIKMIALRCAGFNNVDLAAAKRAEISVVRVPAYSPHAVAEHALALILCLDRKIHRAHLRVKELNFSLDGLVGFDLHGKTVGIIGTGAIGAVFARIMWGLGCRILAFDITPQTELIESYHVSYVSLPELYRESDIISLHVPLTKSTHHFIDANALAMMKPGVMIINTGRGGLIDTPALLEALKSGLIGSAGLDVYEEEEGIFFVDLSDSILTDDHLARLMSFPNVLITAHQAFLTQEALQNIAATTIQSITDFQNGAPLQHSIVLDSAQKCDR